MKHTDHIPVLLQDILEKTQPKPGMTIFDGTLGGGGYAEAFSRAVGPDGMVVGTDLDDAALERAQKRTYVSRHQFFNDTYASIKNISDKIAMQFDVAVVDLGLSSDQLDNEKRGFSFKDSEQPLDMRFDAQNGQTAAEILNTWSEESLADIIYGFGGERYARRIAKEIVSIRDEKLFAQVGDLLNVINAATPRSYQHRKSHPATKTFQALRIVVNTEWQHIQEFLEHAPHAVKSGGYIAVVSFHSGEDRVIKHTFRLMQQEGIGTVLTKKPITPSPEELAQNPRSRSALLRIIQIH